MWVNTSSVTVSKFLTFDSGVTAADIALAHDYSFVWGAATEHVSSYRASNNSGISLSYYMPWSRDCSHGDFDQAISYWNESHPDWIMYQCDRETPAWYGSEQGHCVPLDISNPGVSTW